MLPEGTCYWLIQIYMDTHVLQEGANCRLNSEDLVEQDRATAKKEPVPGEHIQNVSLQNVSVTKRLLTNVSLI